MSTNLMGAHNQWASRPNDERFWGLRDMGEAMLNVRASGKERTAPTNAIRAVAHQFPGLDSPDLCVTGTNGVPVTLTHWSGGQLCRYVDAPADYIRALPAPLAAECINHGMREHRKNETASLLINRNPDQSLTLRSLTTDRYSRLWNTDILTALRPAAEHGWMVPPARPVRDDPRARRATLEDIVPGQDSFGLSVKVGDLIAPAGCYASDRDMFVFMVNPQRIIDVDGSDGLMRGFFVWNSEVGAGAFKVQCFYLEAVCGNHIVWGAKGVQTLRLVHKGKNFSSIGYKLNRELRAMSNRDASEERNMVTAARNYVLGKDKAETVDTVFGNRNIGLSKNVIEMAYNEAGVWEHTAKAPPTTAWGLAHGLTRYSQTVPYADQRASIDAGAGKLLQLAYKG